jgi:hypothetical protein
MASIKNFENNLITGLDRPWVFQEAEVQRFQDNRHMKVVRFSAPHPGRLYAQETFLVHISVSGWVNSRAKVRPEGLRQWKIPFTPFGIEPATFRVVPQCLNQLRHQQRAPILLTRTLNNLQTVTILVPPERLSWPIPTLLWSTLPC